MIKINKELEKIIAPLTPNEYEILEQSLIDHGCRDSLVLWNDFIIDGHNRFEICNRHGILFTTTQMEFDNINAVKQWMIINQLGRRNIQDFVKAELMQQYKEIELAKGLKRKAQNLKKGEETPEKPTIGLSGQTHNTTDIIASKLGWSRGKVSMADIVIKNAPESVKELLRSGEISINRAYQDIKKEQLLEQRAVMVETTKTEPASLTNTYDLIYIDPPWRYEFTQSKSRAIENQYPTMSFDELMELNIPANANCVMFMWTTSPKLVEAINLLQAWGFTYKTSGIWDKLLIGMGYWFRNQHEILLVGVKGKISPPISKLRVSSIFQQKRGKHSQKPEFYHELIERSFPNLSKVELFAREKREGWANWGNERLLNTK